MILRDFRPDLPPYEGDATLFKAEVMLGRTLTIMILGSI